jgi:hypothetical protein
VAGSLTAALSTTPGNDTLSVEADCAPTELDSRIAAATSIIAASTCCIATFLSARTTPKTRTLRRQRSLFLPSSGVSLPCSGHAQKDPKTTRPEKGPRATPDRGNPPVGVRSETGVFPTPGWRRPCLPRGPASVNPESLGQQAERLIPRRHVSPTCDDPFGGSAGTGKHFAYSWIALGTYVDRDSS